MVLLLGGEGKGGSAEDRRTSSSVSSLQHMDVEQTLFALLVARTASQDRTMLAVHPSRIEPMVNQMFSTLHTFGM